MNFDQGVGESTTHCYIHAIGLAVGDKIEITTGGMVQHYVVDRIDDARCLMIVRVPPSVIARAIAWWRRFDARFEKMEEHTCVSALIMALLIALMIIVSLVCFGIEKVEKRHHSVNVER